MSEIMAGVITTSRTKMIVTIKRNYIMFIVTPTKKNYKHIYMVDRTSGLIGPKSDVIAFFTTRRW